MQPNKESENRYEEVFGLTFSMYSKEEFLEFMHPFVVRFERNGLDPRAMFEGKTCLDAGCGNGRGSLFMLSNGAAHVSCFDYSATNVESATRFLTEFGYDNFDTALGSLEQLPFPDQHFDFVWCNGVLMHTKRPNACLDEITRVLKVGGRSWQYLYGAGGVYWRVIHHLREMMKPVQVQTCIDHLKLYRYETRYLAEYIDDWFASHLRTYTIEDMRRAYLTRGYGEVLLLPHGMDYDTSHRRNKATSDLELDYMGEGDLRWLLTKDEHGKTEGFQLNEGEYGSNYQWPKCMGEVDSIFKAAAAEAMPAWARVAMAARIQRQLRIMLYDQTGSFDLKTFLDYTKESIGLAQKLSAGQS